MLVKLITLIMAMGLSGLAALIKILGSIASGSIALLADGADSTINMCSILLAVAYIDTSVALSAYKPNETSYNAYLHLARLDHLIKIGSYVLVVGLFLTISRLYSVSKMRVSASTRRILLKLPSFLPTFTITASNIFTYALLFFPLYMLSHPNIGGSILNEHI